VLKNFGIVCLYEPCLIWSTKIQVLPNNLSYTSPVILLSQLNNWMICKLTIAITPSFHKLAWWLLHKKNLKVNFSAKNLDLTSAIKCKVFIYVGLLKLIKWENIINRVAYLVDLLAGGYWTIVVSHCCGFDIYQELSPGILDSFMWGSYPDSFQEVVGFTHMQNCALNSTKGHPRSTSTTKLESLPTVSLWIRT
jgi:hypothetical protein